MQNNIRLQYQQSIDESHHGYPSVVETIYTGSCGRPSIRIDPEFLRWSYSLRSIESISLFLGVSRRIVRQQLLKNGIAQPGEQPFVFSSQNSRAQAGPSHSSLDNTGRHELPEDSDNDLLDPSSASGSFNSSEADLNPHTPPEDMDQTLYITSYTAPQSDITDSELDDCLIRLRRHFRLAGISMLDGMLRRLGYRIPRERIRQSLIRIDPVHQIFQRIRIWRRVYNVPGPNSLWHHDGQHGTTQNFLPNLNVLISI